MKIHLKKLMILLLAISLFHLNCDRSYAQEGGAATDPIVQETVNDLMLVAGSGVAGAILGLSTLPFYGEPTEHFRNVIVGGALGIIVGVGVVAYLQATETTSYYYQDQALQLSPDWNTGEKLAWHYNKSESNVDVNLNQHQAVSWTFDF